MFCPKCGTKNPDDGKFCRSCGLGISGVASSLGSGNPNFMTGLEKGLSSLNSSLNCDGTDEQKLENTRRTDPSEVYADGIKSVISGIGFLVVSMALLMTGVAGGKAWWWALLFPAFGLLSKGVADVLKSKRMIESRNAFFNNADGQTRSFNQSYDNAALPPPQTTFVPPSVTSYQTGDLVPPSVTDNTTKLLELEVDHEDKTRAL